MLLARLGMVVLGILTPLVLVEILLRVAGPLLPGEYQTAAFVARADVVGRRNRPNTSGWKHTAEFTTWVRINSKGLRGPEVPYEKMPDTFRILALGDSFTFALQVNEEDTFEVRLAELLNQQGAGARVEVLNAGVDGWSTANEYEWLATEGYKYSPDLVLLMFFNGNDPGDNADQIADTTSIDRLRLGVHQGGQLDQILDWPRAHFLMYNVAEQTLVARFGTQPTTDLDDGDDPADENQQLSGQQQLDAASTLLGRPAQRPFWNVASARKLRGWQITEVQLARLRNLCAARGIGLVVVDIPTDAQLRNQELTETPLGVLSARVGLPRIDLLGPFRAQSKRLRERLYFQQNRHWTVDGHKVVARILAEEVSRLGMLATADRR